MAQTVCRTMWALVRSVAVHSMKTSLVAGEILLRLPLMMGGIDSTFSLASRMTGYLPEREKGEEGKTKEGDEGGYEGEEEGEDEGRGKKVRHNDAIVRHLHHTQHFSKKIRVIRLSSLSLSSSLSSLSPSLPHERTPRCRRCSPCTV